MNDFQLNEYLDIDSITARFPQFTKNQLRWIIANKDRYEIASAIKRVGRKIYFHVPSFSNWIAGQSA